MPFGSSISAKGREKQHRGNHQAFSSVTRFALQAERCFLRANVFLPFVPLFKFLHPRVFQMSAFTFWISRGINATRITVPSNSSTDSCIDSAKEAIIQKLRLNCGPFGIIVKDSNGQPLADDAPIPSTASQRVGALVVEYPDGTFFLTLSLYLIRRVRTCHLFTSHFVCCVTFFAEHDHYEPVVHQYPILCVLCVIGDSRSQSYTVARKTFQNDQREARLQCLFFRCRTIQQKIKHRIARDGQIYPTYHQVCSIDVLPALMSDSVCLL
jgi:hypothetical protein